MRTFCSLSGSHRRLWKATHAAVGTAVFGNRVREQSSAVRAEPIAVPEDKAAAAGYSASPRPRRGVRLLCAVTVVVTAVATFNSGCTSGNVGARVTTSADDAPLVTAVPAISDQVRDGRGRILSDSAFEALPAALAAHAGKARRAVYQSTSGIDGARTEVSGAFFEPLGQPPASGWPVVALAHGTTGTQHGCAPSDSPDLDGEVGMVASLLKQGYAVAATDYEGLGDQGIHPYLEPRTAAFNVIDSVRGLRDLYGAESDQWVAVGPSQGGQAAWAVNELNSRYGDGLQLVGTVALSPAVNMSGLADRALSRTLTPWQTSLMPYVIDGLSRYDSTVVEDHYLRGQAARDLAVITGCGPDATSARLHTKVEDVRPATAADATALRDALRRIALPQAPLTVPMLVMNGSKDESIPPAWVNAAVERSCKLGGHIRHLEIEGAGHSNLGHTDVVWNWIHDRFTGVPASAGCGDQS